MLASPVAPQGSPALAGPIRAGDFFLEIDQWQSQLIGKEYYVDLIPA
jgi:hypothetical protein